MWCITILYVDLSEFACREKQWWNRVLGSEEWQMVLSSVAAGTEEECCLTAGVL